MAWRRKNKQVSGDDGGPGVKQIVTPLKEPDLSAVIPREASEAVEADVQGNRSRRPYIIPANYRISGAVVSERKVVVYGEFVTGVLEAPAITVTQSGMVSGRVAVGSLRVTGTVNAQIEASIMVEILEGGRVAGSVVAPQIAVCSGGVLNGAKLEICPEGQQFSTA